MTLIYFSNFNTSVFDSQVIFLLNYFTKNYDISKLYMFIGISSEKEKERISINLIDSKIEIVFYKRYPEYPLLSWLSIMSVRKALKRLNINSSNTIIHIRTEILGYFVLKAVNNLRIPVKILIDIRGDLYDEIVIYYKNIFIKLLKVLLLTKTHYYLVKANVYISCVSEELKKFMISKYSYNGEKITIHPCAYSDFFQFNALKRKEIREKLNIARDDLVVVFSSGSQGKWQNSDLILKHLAKIKSIKILNLSKNKINSENVLNFFVPIVEMPYYLSSADIAIIIREENMVNKVASPVKFSEYVACGLPVIANEGVAMIVNIINKHKIGIVVTSMESINERLLKETSKINRNHVIRVAKENFSIKNISNLYYDLYKELLDESN